MEDNVNGKGNVVFIDTNLDTHFALTVSDHDTVSDLKNKISSEHHSCFPNIGQIHIHGVKVKRNGYFYHLSDSMLVRSAFSGFNKSWFLSVDVSALGDCGHNQNLFSHTLIHQGDSTGIANNGLVGFGDNNNNNAIILPCNRLLENEKDERGRIRVVPPCGSERIDKEGITSLEAGVKLSGDKDLAILLQGSNPKMNESGHINNEVPSLHMECEVDGFGKGNKDDGNVCVEESSMSVRSEKKKQKRKRKREDTVGYDNSKEEIPSDRPCVSELAEKEAVKNLETVPYLNIECGLEGSGEGNKDDRNVSEEVPSKSVPSAKRRKKSKKQKEETVGGDNSKEEIPSDRPCVSEHTEKEAVKNMEIVPSLHIECEVGRSREENKEVHSTSVPSSKKKHKSKTEKEDTLRSDISKDKIAAVDNLVGPQSERASSFTNFQIPQSENKQDEKEEIPFDQPCVPNPDPEHNEKAENLKMVPNSNIESEVDGLNKIIKGDSIVCEEGTSKPEQSTKKKHKSKRKKEYTVGGDISKDSIASVDNPVGCPSERASSFNDFQVSQLENKHGENNEIPFDQPSAPELTEKTANNLERVPNTECEVDGSDKVIKDDSIVCEEGTSKPEKSAKKKHKSKRKKEYSVGGDISKDNIGPVDNPVGCPSERASSFNDFQVSQLENKHDENNDIPFDQPSAPEHTEKAANNLERVPNTHTECEVDGSDKGIKGDSIVCEEGTSKVEKSTKKKHKSKRKKEYTVGGDISKDNIASVDNPVGCPSERASSFNDFQVSQLENKHDENNDIPFDQPSAPETEKAANNLERVPNTQTECEVDGSDKGIKGDSVVCEEGTSKPEQSTKKKHKSKRKKEDTVQDDTSIQKGASVGVPVQQDIVVLANSSKNADKEVIKETEVLKEHQNSKINDNNNKNDVNADLSMAEASELITPVKKKHKKKKRSPTHDFKESLKVETASQKDQAQIADESHGERRESKDQFEPSNGKFGHADEYKHNEAEDILDIRPPSKKRQKEKERSKEKSLSNKKMFNDFDVNNSSHHLLEDQQNIKNSSADQPTEHLSTQRESVQEEISANNILSKDIIASKESIQSTTKETNKNRTDIEMEVQPSDVNEPKDVTGGNQNGVHGHYHESEIVKIKGAAEGEVSPQNDDVNGTKEPVKPMKDKKGIKKAKSKNGGQTLSENNGFVDASESETVIAKSLRATDCEPMPKITETQENPLNQTGGKVMQQEEVQGTVRSVTDKGDEFSTDNADSLKETRTKSIAENVDEHGVSKTLKMKSNDKQASTSKGTSDMLTNGHVIYSKAPNAQKTGQVAKLSSPSDSALSSVGENRKSRVNASGKSMDLEKPRAHIPISNSKLERSNNMVQNKAKKASGNHVMGALSNLQKKSLLEGAIFKDDSSSSSEDEVLVDNSDASTRTPSENSFASDSDGYDSPALDSQQNDSYDRKRLENGEISSLKAGLSGSQRMSIDHILRSSSRYKKAKITASQFDESESQPEFVPDSLP